MGTTTETIAAEFNISVEQVDGFEYRVRFDKEQHPEVRMDEPAPLGQDAAPNAARFLAAAVGNCLAASLSFCMKRAGAMPTGVKARVHVTLVRNEQKRIRIGHLDVELDPGPGVDAAALQKCLPTFEDFCTVTQSVRGCLDVRVKVL
jgi:organic hydroperoxide reductase OsmC/OhrA